MLTAFERTGRKAARLESSRAKADLELSGASSNCSGLDTCALRSGSDDRSTSVGLSETIGHLSEVDSQTSEVESLSLLGGCGENGRKSSGQNDGESGETCR